MASPSAPSFQPSLVQAYNQALGLHQGGRLAPAEALYRDILAAAPDHAEALHMLGLLFIQTGRADPGFGLIDRALAVRPDFVDAHLNRGLAMLQLQRPAHALASFDKAIALRRGHVDAHYSRGVALAQLGRPEDALAAFESALSRRPDHVQALVNRGVVLNELRRFDKALGSLNKALALQPRNVEALVNRGITLAATARLDEALASFDKALALAPDAPSALFNKGVALSEAGRPDEALVVLERAAALQPGNPAIHFSRGSVLKALKRLPEALGAFDQAVGIRPDYVQALINRGVVLNLLGRSAEAVDSYDRALTLQPRSVEALVSRGTALNALGRLDEALATYDRALAVAPHSPVARFNKSLVLLQQGRFDLGLPLYEARNALPGAPAELAALPPQQAWTTEGALGGRPLFVRWEQGLGDTIQFCRYALVAADAGAEVTLSVQDELAPLLARLDPRVKVVGAKAAPERDGLKAALMSLPLAFGTTPEAIPGSRAYLTADPDQVAAWAERLGPRTRPRVGLAWSGGAAHANDHERSMAFRTVAPLLSAECEWICLQKDIRGADREALAGQPGFRLIGPELRDFSDTAALVANLDLVVSVCTSVAHLGGALGRPTWIMLPYAGEWRWLTEREDTPWYASVRLFRQPAPGDWASVIGQVREELAGMS